MFKQALIQQPHDNAPNTGGLRVSHVCARLAHRGVQTFVRKVFSLVMRWSAVRVCGPLRRPEAADPRRRPDHRAGPPISRRGEGAGWEGLTVALAPPAARDGPGKEAEMVPQVPAEPSPCANPETSGIQLTGKRVLNFKVPFSF